MLNLGECEYSLRLLDVIVEHRGILRREFEIIVQLRTALCLFASFLMLHDCVPSKEGAKHITDRLPKKNIEFVFTTRYSEVRLSHGLPHAERLTKLLFRSQYSVVYHF